VIKTTTRLFGAIGDPIAHSLSPLMQNWFFQHFGIDAAYLAFHVHRERLSGCVEGMRALNITGLNVTVPHKEAVMAFVDQLSPDVAVIGAANTLQNDGSKISAAVTDPYGFIESLGAARDRFPGAGVVLFGAGGAGKSVAFALARLGIQRLTIVESIDEKAKSLAALARQKFHIPMVETLQVESPDLNEAIQQSTIVINATPQGMHPNLKGLVITDFSAFSKRHLVYDLVYNPVTTRFLAEAKTKGATTLGGLDMLIFQGLQSLRIWMEEDYKLEERPLQQVRKLLMTELRIHE